MNTTTVLIIGAGPVGLTLAIELARQNVPFRIIERSALPQHGSRAKGVQPRSLEIFNDLGIAEKLMAAGSTTLPYRRYFGTKLVGEIPRKTFERNDTRYPKTLLIQQPLVEEALRTKLGELNGKIEWSTELTDFTQTDAGVVCHLEHPNYSEEVGCRYMVACDGGKSSTRKKAGIGFEGETHQEEQLWVGDVELEGLTRDAWYNWMSPTFGLAFALFPFAQTNTWQLQAVMPADEHGNVPAPTLEGFRELFKERTGMEDVTFTSSTWQSIYRVNIRRASHYRAGNIFLAGDVAHAHSIAGGMGMNTGIQDASNLGWKLGAVINGLAGDKLLDTYGEERIPIADWTLKTTADRQKAMMAGATSGKGGFENLGTSDTTQLNLEYRNSSLSAKGLTTSTGLQAGDRAPDVQLTGRTGNDTDAGNDGGTGNDTGTGNDGRTGNDDRKWLSDDLHGPEWKLLLFGNQMPTGPVKPIKATDEAIARMYGLSDGLVLIRPDGYIALITANPADIDNYFQKLK